MKGPYTKKTGLDYLKNKDDSLAKEDENNIWFDVCSKDHPEGIQHIIKSALCRETGGDRRLADILDIKAASCHDRYSFEPGTNTRVREDASNVKPNQTNVHESCNKNMINYYLNNDGGNSKMFVNDIPKDEHYQVCRSCKFLAKDAEKLKETGTRYTDITKEELYDNSRIGD